VTPVPSVTRVSVSDVCLSVCRSFVVGDVCIAAKRCVILEQKLLAVYGSHESIDTKMIGLP